MKPRSFAFIGFITGFLLLVMAATHAYTTHLKLSGVNSRIIILISIAIPLLFVLAMLGSRTASFIPSGAYTIIMGIVGIAFYIFLGGILMLVISLLSKFFAFEIPRSIPLAVLLITTLMGIAGLIQARFITTTSYTVSIPSLPEELNGKTAVLVTDTHFGLVNHAHFSDKVVSAILKLNPTFVLHGGDFYDGPKNDTAPITESWKRLVSQIPVFYAPGNHEEYGDYAGFLTSIRNAGVIVLDDKVTTFKGIQIAGLTYRDGKEPEGVDAALAALKLDADIPSILINHPPTSLSAAETAGIDLMVSGHTHNGQFWPLNFLTQKLYGIYNYGLHPYKTLQVLTSNGVGTFGPPLRLFNPSELVHITFIRS